MAVSAAERRYILEQLTRLAQGDLKALWDVASGFASSEFVQYMTTGFSEIGADYNQLAAQVAATWFEDSAPESTYSAVLADQPDAERLIKSAQWALGGDGEQALARMEGSMQRAVFDGARDTTLVNVESTGSRFIRVARPQACEFCRMLATRSGEYAYRGASVKIDPLTGKQYADGRLTTTVVGQRARNRKPTSRTRGSEYHDFCYCTAVEVRDGQSVSEVLTADEQKLLQQWNDEYAKARANAGTTETKKLLAAWREQSSSVATAGVDVFDRSVLDSAATVEQVGKYIKGKHGINVDGLLDSPMAKGFPIDQSLKSGVDVFSAARAAKEREMDARTAREFGQAVDDVLTKYPFLKLDAIRADYAPYGDPLHGLAYTTPKLDADFKRIGGAENVTICGLVDEKGKEGVEWKRRQLSMLQADNRYAASSYERPVYADMVHEMGHVMDFNSGGNAVPAAQSAIRRHIAGLPGAPAKNSPDFEAFEKKWLEEELVSAYSFETPDGLFGRENPVYWVEALAEAFADVEIRGEGADVASKIIHEAMVFEARKFSTPPKSTVELLNEIKLPGVDS